MARWYDPEVRRFVSKDKIDNLNRYDYVKNNPILNIDPSGLCIWDGCVGEIIAGAAVISAAVVVVTNPIWQNALHNTIDNIGQMCRPKKPTTICYLSSFYRNQVKMITYCAWYCSYSNGQKGYMLTTTSLWGDCSTTDPSTP
jgi:hypothetical protein